ncbi:MAG: hypothetical protein RLZZ324_969 [Candidatus Parcubacteria bacterium]|jgi:uncharacterized protein YebE (UPF0316 family)
MILFFVGVIEMTIAASWTRSVAKSSVYVNGLITYANIFVWYYVLGQVIDNLKAGWVAILPYAAGCAIGSMLGSTGPKAVRLGMRKMYRRFMKARKVSRTRKATPITLRAPAEY